jgi:hypothetical protein
VALTACADPTGTIRGQLIAGGAPPGSNNPLPGTVAAHRGSYPTGPVVATDRAGADGRFTLRITSPGIYFITGSSPRVPGFLCQGGAVDVSRGAVRIADILCSP